MITNREPYSIFLVMGGIVFLFMFWGIYHLSLSYKNPAQIEKQLKIWNKFKPDNYSYSITTGCMYGSESKVVVKDNKELTYNNQGSNSYNTMQIKEMFAEAKRALIEASEVRITYNDVYGFPETIFVDWNSNSSDDECYYRIEKFTVYP